MDVFHDFQPIWAAARIAVIGGNPYDPSLIVKTLSLEGVDVTYFPGGFHHPFWLIPIIYPLGFLDLFTAKILWLLLMLASLIRIRQILKIDLVKFILWTLLFSPMFKNILFGQFGLFMLMFFLESRRGESWVAGVFSFLMSIKLHITWPIILILFYKKLSQPFLVGFIACAALMGSMALIISPNVVYHFVSEVSRVSAISSSTLQPGVISILIRYSDWDFVIWSLSISLGLVAVHKVRRLDGAYDIAAQIGLAISGYVWSHDFLLLLPAFIYWASKQTTTYILLFVVFSFAPFLFGGVKGEFLLLWIPIFLLMKYYQSNNSRIWPEHR